MHPFTLGMNTFIVIMTARLLTHPYVWGKHTINVQQQRLHQIPSWLHQAHILSTEWVVQV